MAGKWPKDVGIFSSIRDIGSKILRPIEKFVSKAVPKEIRPLTRPIEMGVKEAFPTVVTTAATALGGPWAGAAAAKITGAGGFLGLPTTIFGLIEGAQAAPLPTLPSVATPPLIPRPYGPVAGFEWTGPPGVLPPPGVTPPSLFDQPGIYSDIPEIAGGLPMPVPAVQGPKVGPVVSAAGRLIGVYVAGKYFSARHIYQFIQRFGLEAIQYLVQATGLNSQQISALALKGATRRRRRRGITARQLANARRVNRTIACWQKDLGKSHRCSCR